LHRLPNVAWDALGRVNAGRLAPKSGAELRVYVEAVASLPLHQAYPVLAWAIGNLRAKTEDTDQALTTLKPFLEASLVVAELGSSLTIADRGMPSAGSHQRTNVSPIGVGQVDSAHRIVTEWIDKHVRDTCLIVDAYFAPQDMWIVQKIAYRSPKCRIVVLTGTAGHNGSGVSARQAYRDGWRHISDDPCPWLEIVVVECSKTSQCPMHDRALFANTVALTMGTSVGGLGWRESVLVELDSDQTHPVLERVNPYLQKTVQNSAAGARLDYMSFTL
jgi:hypothetical protein